MIISNPFQLILLFFFFFSRFNLQANYIYGSRNASLVIHCVLSSFFLSLNALRKSQMNFFLSLKSRLELSAVRWRRRCVALIGEAGWMIRMGNKARAVPF
jgi:hypothetical protein